jgi:hypothetical protein
MTPANVPGIQSLRQPFEAVELYATEKPYDKQNDQHGAENPAKAGAAVTAMGIIAAAAAKQQNQDDYDQNRAHD